MGSKDNRLTAEETNEYTESNMSRARTSRSQSICQQNIFFIFYFYFY